MKRQLRVKVQGKWHTVELEELQGRPFDVTVDGEAMEVDVETEGMEVERQPEASTSTPSRPTAAKPTGPVGLLTITQEDQKIIRSPMPGRIVSISVQVWDAVPLGTEICVLETMKMEQIIRLSQQGVIRAVFVHPGQNVSVGEPLVQLE